MIGTRRSFLQFLGTATAGVAVTPLLRGLDIGLYKGAREPEAAPGKPVPLSLDPDNTLWVQRLRDGESIIGPFVFWELSMSSETQVDEMYQARFLRAGEYGALMDMKVHHKAFMQWQAIPGREIIIEEGEAMQFRCSSRDVVASIFFDKVSASRLARLLESQSLDDSALPE